ncbi:hypothetical protein ACVBGC_24920 [Burkholderia stagnalis]
MRAGIAGAIERARRDHVAEAGRADLREHRFGAKGVFERLGDRAVLQFDAAMQAVIAAVDREHG